MSKVAIVDLLKAIQTILIDRNGTVVKEKEMVLPSELLNYNFIKQYENRREPTKVKENKINNTQSRECKRRLAQIAKSKIINVTPIEEYND